MVAQIETIRKTLYIIIETQKKKADQESTNVLQTQTFKVLIRVEGRKEKECFKKTKLLHQLSNNRRTIPNLFYNRGTNKLKQLSNLNNSRLTSTLKTNVRRTIATVVTTKAPSKLNYQANATKHYNRQTKTTKSNN